MKKMFLFLFVLAAATGMNAQSLKDALYSGKLRTDSGTTIRKGEDLANKIDTTRKKPVEVEKPKTVIATPASSNQGNNNVLNTVPDSVASSSKPDPKDNNKTWNNYVNSVVDVLKTEVLNSKKIKKGDYQVMVDYVIETTGTVTISNVFVTPESKFLEEQVRERFSIDTPVLSPVLGSNGKPRKVNKRSTLNLTKD
jgi:hypothetical protein